jgi:hypothetical protein
MNAVKKIQKDPNLAPNVDSFYLDSQDTDTVSRAGAKIFSAMYGSKRELKELRSYQYQ